MTTTKSIATKNPTAVRFVDESDQGPTAEQIADYTAKVEALVAAQEQPAQPTVTATPAPAPAPTFKAAAVVGSHNFANRVVVSITTGIKKGRPGKEADDFSPAIEAEPDLVGYVAKNEDGQVIARGFSDAEFEVSLRSALIEFIPSDGGSTDRIRSSLLTGRVYKGYLFTLSIDEDPTTGTYAAILDGGRIATQLKNAAQAASLLLMQASVAVACFKFEVSEKLGLDLTTTLKTSRPATKADGAATPGSKAGGTKRVFHFETLDDVYNDSSYTLKNAGAGYWYAKTRDAGLAYSSCKPSVQCGIIEYARKNVYRDIDKASPDALRQIENAVAKYPAKV